MVMEHGIIMELISIMQCLEKCLGGGGVSCCGMALDFDRGIVDYTSIVFFFLSSSLYGENRYTSVVCNSNYGYGISADMQGKFKSINSAVVWDLLVVMHEIG